MIIKLKCLVSKALTVYFHTSLYLFLFNLMANFV